MSGVGRFVGQSVKRREDPRLVTGHGRFVDDVSTPPGTVHVAFVRSNVAHGRITRLDTTAAEQLEGVVAVYTAKDLNSLCRGFWATQMGPPSDEMPYPPQHVLAEHDVRFVGDPIAVVLAVNRYVAEDAADLVEVDVEVLPSVSDPVEALLPGAPVVHPEKGTNLGSTLPVVPDPEIDEIFATAAHVVTRTFRQARATNVPMETRGLIASYDSYAGDMRVWVSSQCPHEYRAVAARALGLSESAVNAVQGDVGGGFGQKMFVGREDVAVFLSTFVLGRPVKWIEDRRESLMASNQARMEQAEISAAVDADGKVLALRVHQIEDVGAFPFGALASAAMLSALVVSSVYKIPKVQYSAQSVFTNTCGRGAYRGPWMMESVAREQLLDHIAREIGMDPVEIRRRNLVRAEDQPYVLPSMIPMSEVTAVETLDQALEMIGYDKFRSEQAAARAEGRYLGIGVALFAEPSALSFGQGVLSNEGAIVRVSPGGGVDVYIGSGNHGQSLETTVAQVVAEALGARFEDVTVHQGDAQATPFSVGTGGSRSAVFLSTASQAACTQIRDKMLQIAANQLEAAPEDLEIAESMVSVKGSPERALHFAHIAAAAYMAPQFLPEGGLPGLEAVGRFYSPMPFTWSNAAHVCTVEVDPDTGMTEILRYVVSEDCGNMVNPMVVEGQISGGVVQGIGGVLFEELLYDPDGNPLTTSFLDYLIPTAPEVPEIEIGHVETPATTNPGGFKGMGEGGAIGSVPCVANAVADALVPFGVAPLRFPFGPSQLFEAIAAG